MKLSVAPTSPKKYLSLGRHGICLITPLSSAPLPRSLSAISLPVPKAVSLTGLHTPQGQIVDVSLAMCSRPTPEFVLTEHLLNWTDVSRAHGQQNGFILWPQRPTEEYAGSWTLSWEVGRPRPSWRSQRKRNPSTSYELNEEKCSLGKNLLNEIPESSNCQGAKSSPCVRGEKVVFSHHQPELGCAGEGASSCA